MRKPVGILHIKVIRAMKLKKKDLLGGADPFVKLKLTDDKTPSKKTTVKHKNLNPEWNEEFKLTVRDPETQSLQLNMYDWEQVFLGGLICFDVYVWMRLISKLLFSVNVRLVNMRKWV